MARIVLIGVAAVLLTVGAVAAWRTLHPPPEPVAEVPLDQRPYDQTTDKEREDWMRKLGYVD